MKSKALIALLLMASLHGQASHATNHLVMMSAKRLNSLSAQDLTYLAQNGVIRLDGEQVLLDVSKLEALIRKSGYSEDSGDAKLVRARFIPYGMTP